MTSTKKEHSGVRQTYYKCAKCGHRIKIYEREEQAVYCTCGDEGPPMIPDYHDE